MQTIAQPDRRRRLRAVIVLSCVASITGCASWQGPRIDPSGARILVWPNQPPPVVAAPPVGAPIVATPGLPVVPAPAAPPSFGNLQAPPVYSDPTGVPITAPVVPALPPSAPVAGTTPGVVASGSPAAIPPVMPTPLVAALPVGREHLRVTPGYLVAPVGSEVVLKAGICGPDGHLITNRQVEWQLALNGPGQFVEPSLQGASHILSWWEMPRRIDNWRMAGSTAAVPLSLHRGTPDPRDDVPIVRGETWIALTSAVEGTSVVTAYAPSLSEWNRTATTIQWIDAQGPAAPPPTAPPIVSPPPPLPPSQPEPQPAATPAPISPAVPSTPSAAAPQAGRPQLSLELRRTSPEQLGVGEFASFEVTVTNTGTEIARGIVVHDRFDRGLRHPRAKPNEFAVEYTGLRDLQPGETASVPLTFEVIAAGTQCHEVTITAEGAEAVKERACVTARQAALDVTVTAPRSRVVGEIAEFNVVVKNVGDVAAQNVEIVIRFDAALAADRIADASHKRLPDGAVVLSIERLEPGERRPFPMTARCVSPSERPATVRATVTADGGIVVAGEGNVEILPAQ